MINPAICEETTRCDKNTLARFVMASVRVAKISSLKA